MPNFRIDEQRVVMKKVLACLLLFVFSSSFALETCPKPEEIKPADFMSLTVYKAPDYQSRWFYEPNLKVISFMKAEATAEQVQECWYKAKNLDTGKEIIMTLSPMILIGPELKHKNWKNIKHNYYHCEDSKLENCPLLDGKRLK